MDWRGRGGYSEFPLVGKWQKIGGVSSSYSDSRRNISCAVNWGRQYGKEAVLWIQLLTLHLSTEYPSVECLISVNLRFLSYTRIIVPISWGCSEDKQSYGNSTHNKSLISISSFYLPSSLLFLLSPPWSRPPIILSAESIQRPPHCSFDTYYCVISSLFYSL